jgi:hypothetical protein
VTWGQNGPEPDVDVDERRLGAAAVRRAAADRGVVPTAPPTHTVRARPRTTRVSLRPTRI